MTVRRVSWPDLAAAEGQAHLGGTPGGERRIPRVQFETDPAPPQAFRDLADRARPKERIQDAVADPRRREDTALGERWRERREVSARVRRRRDRPDRSGIALAVCLDLQRERRRGF